MAKTQKNTKIAAAKTKTCLRRTERRKAQGRPKAQRRRQIDPTTCERDYSPDEMEFMNAIDLFKRQTGRSFPMYGDVLSILFELGYRMREKVCSKDSNLQNQSLSTASMAEAQTTVGD